MVVVVPVMVEVVLLLEAVYTCKQSKVRRPSYVARTAVTYR